MRREQAGANKIVRKRKLTLSDRLLYAMILVIGILAGQSMGAPIQGTSMETVQETTLSGTVTMAGSTSMETFVNALAEGFMNRYPQVIVTAEFTGSSAGMRQYWQAVWILVIPPDGCARKKRQLGRWSMLWLWMG